MGRCWNDASRSSCSRGRVIGVGFGLFIFCVSIDRLSIVIDIYRLLVSRFTSTTRCRLIEFDSLSMFFIMVVLFFRKTGNVVKSLKSASLQLGLACFFCVSIDRLSIVIDIYRLLVSRFTSTTRCRLIDFDSLSMFFITVVRFFRKTGNVVKSLKSDRQKQERVRGWNGTNCGVVPVLVRRCRFVSMPIRVLVQFLLFFIVVSFFLKRCSAFL